MNPTAALMLSREFEEDRRRALAARRNRTVDAESSDEVAKRDRPGIWALLAHLPRFHPAR